MLFIYVYVYTCIYECMYIHINIYVHNHSLPFPGTLSLGAVGGCWRLVGKLLADISVEGSFSTIFFVFSWIFFAPSSMIILKPSLRQFDANGRRIDVIDYHDSYHLLMKDGIEGGTTSYGYNNDWKKNGDGHLVRAALMYMQNQVEPGHCCPLVMTSAVIPVLQAEQGKSNGAIPSWQ